MVPLAYVDQVYSEKIRKLQHETTMAKRAIRKMNYRLIDSQVSSARQVALLAAENAELKNRMQTLTAKHVKAGCEDSICREIVLLEQVSGPQAHVAEQNLVAEESDDDLLPEDDHISELS